MAIRSSKPSTPAERPAEQDDGETFGVMLAALEALRDEIAALRDEVRALSQRRSNRRARDRHDPGDGVPPGVAVQEPAPLTTGDRRAKRSLERLGRG